MTNKFSLKDILRFIVPSTLGVLIFLTPMFVDGRPTIGMGIIFELLRGVTQDYLPGFVTVLLFVSCCCSTYFSLSKKKHRQRPTNQIEQIFTTTISWLIIRILGSVFAGLVFFSVGPDWIISPSTGGTVLFQLASTLAVFFFSCVFIVTLSY